MQCQGTVVLCLHYSPLLCCGGPLALLSQVKRRRNEWGDTQSISVPRDRMFEQAAVGNALCAARKVEKYSFRLQGRGYFRKDNGVI